MCENKYFRERTTKIARFIIIKFYLIYVVESTACVPLSISRPFYRVLLLLVVVVV